MDYDWEMRTVSSEDGPHDLYTAPEEKPEQVSKWEQQGDQTGAWRSEKEVSTDEDWESQIAAVEEHSSSLARQHSNLLKRQEEEEAECEKHKEDLEKKKEDAVCKHKALLDKIESLNVKLQLNNSKAARVSFAAKKQELSTEKKKTEEEESRLSKELEESERKLMLLMEEQTQEKEMWERELGELKKEMEGVKKEAEEADRAAALDEITAVEAHRDVTMAQIDAWLREVGQYLSALRMDHSQHHVHKRLEWEKHERLVRSSQAELQNQFQGALDQLRQGRELDSLPPINPPPLPPSPMVDLIISQMVIRPMLAPPHAMGGMPFPPQERPHFRTPMRVTPPPPNTSPTPAAQPFYPVGPPPQFLLPTNPPPAGKLDKLLDKLGAKFPQCTREQLMLVLQQIKASRGTMAGMSMDDVNEQVALKLAQMERAAPGPISRPPPAAARSSSCTLQVGPGVHLQYAPGHTQRSTLSPQRPVVFQTRPPQPPVAAASRKLCLMCQNHVDADSQYPLSCSHTIHKDCISVWLKSSKNNTCPFCSSSH